MRLCIGFVVLSLLITLPAITNSVETVNITDGEILMEYLCSSHQTIPPDTHLIIYDSISLNLKNIPCIVENTSNIYISAKEYSNSEQKSVTLFCNNSGGFSFFNVINLTINSIYFQGCGWGAIPQNARKYVDGPDQFFYYSTTNTTLYFSHCHNLTLYNVLADSFANNNANRASIIGVNLCGWSNITAVNSSLDQKSPLITILIYYTDSDIMDSNFECHMYIKSNLLSGNKHVDIVHDLANSVERMPILPIRDFALYIITATL